jgi:hypothetical protein
MTQARKVPATTVRQSSWFVPVRGEDAIRTGCSAQYVVCRQPNAARKKASVFAVNEDCSPSVAFRK